MDIGGGVFVEATTLSRLSVHHKGSPCRFARDLLRAVFTEDELRGRSLTGRKCNAQKDAVAKDPLDPVRVSAVIGECLLFF